MSTRDVTENWPAISDDEVMAAVKTGSANAFAVLYDRYHTEAYRIAWAMCRDSGRAEEAVQETFARHRAIDIARRNGRDCAHQTTDDRLDGLHERSDVAALAAARAQTHHVLSLLAQLPDAQREVITLAFYGQQTHTEIAATSNFRRAPSRAECASAWSDCGAASNDEKAPVTAQLRHAPLARSVRLFAPGRGPRTRVRQTPRGSEGALSSRSSTSAGPSSAGRARPAVTVGVRSGLRGIRGG